MANNRIVGNGDGLQVVPVQSVEIGSRRIGEEEMFVDMATGARYLRGPGGQPESIVMARTSPGGGVALSAGDSPLWLQGTPLLDRVPLPTIRSIADPENMDIANAVLTDGVSLAWIDEPNERYGRALEVTIPGAITNKWAQIPLKPNWDGNYPKSTSAVQFRLKIDESEPITTLMPWVAESIGSATAARVGYLVSVRGGTDRQGWKGTFASRWNGRYRNYALLNALASKQQSPAEWSRATPEYETRAIIFSITTTGPAKFRLSRAYSEEWPVAGIVTQFDGAYVESTGFMQEVLDIGWPCVASLNGFSTASADDQFLKECIRRGWDLIQHVTNPTQTVPPESGVIDGTMTDADLRRVTAAWSRAMQSRGLYTDRGRAAVSHLQNNSPRGVANAVSVYRGMGVKTSRGFCLDNEWGVDIGDGLTTQYPTYIWSGWASLNGRYNRRMVPASDGSLSLEARHLYAGSRLEEALLNTIAAKEMTWFYFHRLQEYAPPTFPEVSQSSFDFAESWKQHMIDEERAGRVVMLTASQVDLLTYDRPGDVYLRWDGAWVSRSSSAVEDDRRVVL